MDYHSARQYQKADKYIFAAVNLNTEIVDYITSNGLGAFNYKEFTQEVGKLADQTNGFIMFNENYPNITPATNLYEDKAEAENIIFQYQSAVLLQRVLYSLHLRLK